MEESESSIHVRMFQRSANSKWGSMLIWKSLLPRALIWLALVISCDHAGDGQKSSPAASALSALADSITATPMASGRYTIVKQFFEGLSALREAQGDDSARSVLVDFLGRLHPRVRVTDSLAVFQTVEWIGNCFTLMDPGAVFFTNGDADTYAAWYLQQVQGVRPDLLVVSLPFLVAPHYRRFLQSDARSREALNLFGQDTLPVPPSTGQTQATLVEIVTHLAESRGHPAIYIAPSCGVSKRFGNHLVDLGLVYAYQDSVQPQSKTLDLLMSKLSREWKLKYASQGEPKDSSYAARVAWLQYLTLLIRMAPKFENAGRYSDLDTLFAYIEPVVGDDWRFSMLRYQYCHQTDAQCSEYRERVKAYATDHPEDGAVRAALRQFKDK
jgi:hypothetical protein